MAENNDERRATVLKFVCNVLMKKKPEKTLLDRLKQNETVENNAIAVTKIWRGKKSTQKEVPVIETSKEEDAEKLRQRKLLEKVCNTLYGKKSATPGPKPRGRRNALVENEKNRRTSVVDEAVSKWRTRNPDKANDNSLLARCMRRVANRRNDAPRQRDLEAMRQKKKEAARKRFQNTVKRVRILTRVFRNMRSYAIEKGQHMRGLGSVLSENEENKRVEKDLMFNQDIFNRTESCIPNWAYYTCCLPPEERSSTNVQNLVHLLQPLKSFRKYSQKKQELLARIVRYESFGRRRVIIRKGHVGLSFYLVYSGSVAIVIQGDEDKAFVDDSATANIMTRGDSFGELALVKATTRSATVVCLEKTELFVIDKDAFFALGIHTFSKEEIEHRRMCINSLELFHDLSEETKSGIADDGRVVSYLCDKVIDTDSSTSQFVYFVTKGCAYVLRLLDLTKVEDAARKDKLKNRDQWSRTSLQSCSSGTLSIKSSDSRKSSTSTELSLDSGLSVPKGDNNGTRRVSLLPGMSPVSASVSSNSDTTLSDHHFENQRSKKNTLDSNKKYQGITSRHRQKMKETGRNLAHLYGGTNLGLGAFLKVDIIHPGQAFGLSYILPDMEEDQRKFVLISSGCQLIRIPRTLMKEIADENMLKKIRRNVLPYPSDKELYETFNVYNKWRCYREELVDHIAVSRGNRINQPAYPNSASSRSQTSSQSRNFKSSNTWTIKSSRYPSEFITRESPFVQEKLVAAVGSQTDRKLVLTHGGSRLNKLQLATKSPLLQSRTSTVNSFSRY